MVDGIRTTNLERQFAIDELVGNVTEDGVEKTARIPVSAVTNQLAASGPFIFGNTIYALTRAALLAITPSRETMGGVVLNDATAAYNGYYARSAAAWVRGRGFPDTLAFVTLTGSANAQTGSIAAGVDPGNIREFIATPSTPNTGPMTLTQNGVTQPVLNYAGNPMSAGEWATFVRYRDDGAGNFRLTIDANAAAVASAAASSAGADRIAAQEAAAAALAAVSGVTAPVATVAAMIADDPDVDPAYYRVDFFDTNYVRGSGAKYKAVGADPGHPGAYQNANGVWYEIAETLINAAMLGVKYDGVTAAQAALAQADDVAIALGVPLAITGDYAVADNLTIDSRCFLTGKAIVAANKTLAFSLPFVAGLWQAFDLSASGSLVDVPDAIGEVHPEWWGAKCDGATDCTDAMNKAIQAYDVVRLSGEYRITSSIYVNRDGISILGYGPLKSKMWFDPPGAGVMFYCQAANPANLLQYLTFHDFGIRATYPHAFKKQGFYFADCSHVLVDGVKWVDYSWQGATSYGFHFAGRDQHTLRNVHCNADRPINVSKNANSSVFQFDVYHFEDLSLQCLDASEYGIHFNTGVNISQWTVDGRSIMLQGKGAIYFNDTETGTTASSQINITMRIESGPATGTGDAGGYGIYMDFGSGNPYCGNINIHNSSVNDPAVNGYYFSRVAVVRLTDINCGFGSGITALGLNDVLAADINALGVGHDDAIVSIVGMDTVRTVLFNHTPVGNDSIFIGEYKKTV